MNNIQNLHVVIPHINGEAVNHYAGYEQHTKFTYCQYHTEQPYLKVHLLIVGKCWHEIDLVSHCIYCYLCFYIIEK